MGKGTNSGVMHHAKSMIAPPGRGIEWWGRNDACEVTGRDGHAAISGTTRRRDDNNLISSSALHLQLHLTNQTLLNSLEAKYGSTTQAVSRTKRGSSKKLHDHPQAKITSMRHSTSHNSRFLASMTFLSDLIQPEMSKSGDEAGGERFTRVGR